MANKNAGLGAAKSAKNDEFYTQLSDIEKELRHYRQHFRGKTVLCNCDDPFESNFFKYFVLNFNRLGLKKLIATCYAGSPIMGSQLQYHVRKDGQISFSFEEPREDNTRQPYKAIITQVYDKTGDGGVDMIDVAQLFVSGENQLTKLEENGDFRSKECLELLDEADIVVTNPPFSLFREYVATLIEHEKKFVIMGNKNAITYKEFFPLLKDNKVWVGATSLNGGRWMIMPRGIDVHSSKAKLNERGEVILNVAGVCWFTNLDIKRRHEELILVKRYSSELYPSYDNYDAINVDNVQDIPYDYAGIMGVPITFLDKYSPDQFEIIGIAKRGAGDPSLKTRVYTKNEYNNYSDLNAGPTLLENGILKNTYPRILIRNKHPEQPKGEQ